MLIFTAMLGLPGWAMEFCYGIAGLVVVGIGQRAVLGLRVVRHEYFKKIGAFL